MGEPEADDGAEVVIIRPGVDRLGGMRVAMPKVTSRPNGASAAKRASNTRPPVISRTTSTGRPSFAATQGVAQVGRVAGVDRGPADVGAEPGGQVPLLGRGRGGDDAACAQLAGQLNSEAADAARGRVDDDRLTGRIRALVRSRCQAVVPCSTKASAVVSSTESGQRERGRRVGDRLLGVPAIGEQRDDAAAVVVAADDLGARDERELLRGQVVVGGLVGVGVVDAGCAHLEPQQRLAGSGAGSSTSSSTSGPPNAVTWMARMGGTLTGSAGRSAPSGREGGRPAGVPGGSPITSRP